MPKARLKMSSNGQQRYSNTRVPLLSGPFLILLVFSSLLLIVHWIGHQRQEGWLFSRWTHGSQILGIHRWNLDCLYVLLFLLPFLFRSLVSSVCFCFYSGTPCQAPQDRCRLW
jgi:hypothetical protein